MPIPGPSTASTITRTSYCRGYSSTKLTYQGGELLEQTVSALMTAQPQTTGSVTLPERATILASVQGARVWEAMP